MRTFTSRPRRSGPVPRQLGQGSSTTTPVPWQVVHGVENEKKPWLSSVTPRPPHVGHTWGVVPDLAPVPWHTEHAASDVSWRAVVTPWMASVNDSRSVATRSSPRRGPTPRPAAPAPPRAPRPKRLPRMSPRPSPALNVNDPDPGPPGPPLNGAPIGPILRTSSYSLRLASSPTTS